MIQKSPTNRFQQLPHCPAIVGMNMAYRIGIKIGIVPNPSFLRPSAIRAMSDVFYRRSNQQLEYNETQILDTLDDGDFLMSYKLTHIKVQGYQLAYLTMKKKEEEEDDDDVDSGENDEEERSIDVSQLSRETTRQHVAEVLNEYDFLLLVERMDESLVVLRFLLDLDTDDLLHYQFEVGGQLRNVAFRRNLSSYPTVDCIRCHDAIFVIIRLAQSTLRGLSVACCHRC
ncbi:galactose-3-O-sulfotransferase [Nitzschia inconspicua]|uniref:Galactose-3-O-sulfotransferase n=1 Tax=Nitzschia inconspicua TaxID=303405 RepID=A0A9K3PAA1_9STRA|nr:galactose-3-O-sulfotransferase [Nitzschia inconspicua]